MSETTTVEPPVEATPLHRRVSDPKPQTFSTRASGEAPVVAPRNGFSFWQVAALVGIAVFVNGMFLLFVALRTPTPATPVPAAVAPAASQSPVVKSPVASAPALVTPPETKPAAVRPVASKPTAVIAHVVKHRPIPVAGRVTSRAPLVLAAPVIDTVEYEGPIVHLAWKSLGKEVTYKVYVMPNVKQPSFEFRFNKYGPSMDWFLDENKSWRYVAITAVGKNGKESALSNVVDTTPTLPKPEY